MWPWRSSKRPALILAVVGLVATAAGGCSAHHQARGLPSQGSVDRESRCGGPRWPIKTLADPAVTSVVLTHVHDTNVAGLRGAPVPAVDKATARVPGIETIVVRITASLVSGRVSPDGDLAVVVSVPGTRDQTMTVEFPDPHCLGPDTPSPARARAVAARQAFEQGCGRFRTAKSALTGTATLSGVQFLDTPHKLKNGVNARQAAPNEVELHPVLDVAALSCAQSRAN